MTQINDEFFINAYNKMDLDGILFLADRGYTFGLDNGNIESLDYVDGGDDVNE